MARTEITRGQGHNLQHVPISVESGTTELVPGVPGKIISIVSYVIVVDSDGTVAFSDGGALSGAMPFKANGGVVANGQASSPWFWTSEGSALSLVTTAPAFGHLTYTQ